MGEAAVSQTAGESRYHATYAQWKADPAAFWGEAAKAIEAALAGAPAAKTVDFCEGLFRCAEALAAEDPDARAGEIGDLLFAVVNLARWLDVESESARRGASGRLYSCFEYIEQQRAAQGRDLDEMALADMDALWDDAKANGL